MDFDPPLASTYRSLLEGMDSSEDHVAEVEECELPLIDLARLSGGAAARERCMREIAVVNHGVPAERFDRIRSVQLEAFRQPFESKVNEGFLDYSSESYRWGNPSATSLQQLSWSEAYHISTIPSPPPASPGTLRGVRFFSVGTGSEVRRDTSGAPGMQEVLFEEVCSSSTSYLRLNRYPPCPAHSAFLTILHQDKVGGLQLRKGERWVAVKPIPHSLVVNIGDLLEFRSVEHRVMANREVERFSMAFFLCPSHDTVIESVRKPSVYRPFSFGEFQHQVQDDVRTEGYKVGLSRFLVAPGARKP
ncbi:unnamed protein product [Spirodela intermedia]|uniref:Fe2OG dioxygenase domain-containing protein n=1 Tax=Spirodela intermedia TaxID=51605 RepID=A0A7I8IMV4_SPIIN|nr:unnamed protein product [Spirodela intermedia]CAA6658294.1 unnamed protein product [Spirodela intermedia]